MLNNIGIIGYGFVGRACHRAFKENANAIIIDPKINETATFRHLKDIDPPVTFVCVPAPTLADSTVDASIVYDVFEQLTQIQYKGIVVLKSTLPPNIVHDLYEKYGACKVLQKEGPLRYIYSPEFLRESHWESDALNPAMVIFAGDPFDCRDLEKIYQNHSHINDTVYFNADYKEAALIKYAMNSFLAMKVVFMNQLFQTYSDIYGHAPHPDSWLDFISKMSTDNRIGFSHMEVPGRDGKFGFGGSCFPKDLKAFIGFDVNERMTLLRETELANTKIRLTGHQEPK